MFAGLLELLSTIFFFTGRLGSKNAYPKPLSKEEESDCLEKCRPVTKKLLKNLSVTT